MKGSAQVREVVPTIAALGDTFEFMRLIWAIDHGLQMTSKRMHRTLGITGPQRLVIRIVGKFPSISAGELAEILHLHPSTLTGVLSRLVRRGILTRKVDPHDGRKVLLGLTAKGRTLDVAAAGTVESAVEHALRDVPASTAAAARTLMAALAASLEAGPAALTCGSYAHGAAPRARSADPDGGATSRGASPSAGRDALTRAQRCSAS